MNHTGFSYLVRAKIFFTKEEVQGLMWLSAHHYNGHCKQVGCVGGFLYGMMNSYFELDGKQYGEDTYHDLTFRQIDTLAKITEPLFDHPRAMPQLHFQLRKILSEMSLEHSRLNPPDEEVIDVQT